MIGQRETPPPNSIRYDLTAKTNFANRNQQHLQLELLQQIELLKE